MARDGRAKHSVGGSPIPLRGIPPTSCRCPHGLLATFQTFARVVPVLVRLKRTPLIAFVVDNGLIIASNFGLLAYQRHGRPRVDAVRQRLHPACTKPLP